MASKQSAAGQPAGCWAAILSLLGCFAQKLHTAYHLMTQREQLQTPFLHTTTALIGLRGSGLVREAWTDVGNHGEGPTARIWEYETYYQIFATPVGTPSSIPITMVRY